MSAPVLVVEHATDRPGLDCLVAAAIAGALERAGGGVRFIRLRGERVGFEEPGASEHVAVYGALLLNAFLWPERALGTPVARESDEVLGQSGSPSSPEVIAFNPRAFPGAGESELRETVGCRAGRALWVRVDRAGTALVPSLIDESGVRPFGRWARDAYGRLAPIRADQLHPELLARFGRSIRPDPDARPGATRPEAEASDEPIRLALVGESDHHSNVYPAVMAALGDAASSLGWAPGIEFMSSHALAPGDWPRALSGAHGLVLPGGTDMSQAAGQIDAAAAALDQGIPTLGCCLGMQTMTTAVARRRGGLPGADLEETSPRARTFSFSRLPSPDGALVHRVGERVIRVRDGTRTHALYGRERAKERLNHRYRLNPAILPALEAAGLVVSAVADDESEGGIVEAIEVPSHPFFVGLQGHPELSSSTGAPHPAFVGFLRAAAAAARPRRERNG
ncbi:MAG: glutamine amidotransferase-related protein [Alphaproteobacteria bacterium]